MPDASFDAVAWIDALDPATVPVGLQMRDGQVTTPPVYVESIRKYLAHPVGTVYHQLGTARATKLHDALAAHRADDAA